MKRRRNTSTSIIDLPEVIIFEILLYLPLKGIVMCKCTCKTLRHLISSNHFAKLHFARGKCSILLQNVYSGEISRMLYLIEPAKINSKYCRCDGIQSGPQVNMKLDTKLKIPVVYRKGIVEASALCEGNTKNWKPIIRLDSSNYRFSVVNSCNGFLCLLKGKDDCPSVVCNPVTNEYIELPTTCNDHWRSMFGGFGFCQDTNQYKVLRVRDTNRLAEIHTLGTKSWKSIGFAPFYQNYYRCPTHLNGVLYWISDESNQTDLIVSFDFSNECFRSLPQPPITRPPMTSHARISKGIIADCLCVFTDGDGGLIDFWVMKICGVQTSWSKLISITRPPVSEMWLHFSPITCSKCQEFLIIRCGVNFILYYDPRRKEWKDIKLHGIKFDVRAIMYTPSFISLKDVVAGANTKSISTWFKLSGETRSLSLVEEA